MQNSSVVCPGNITFTSNSVDQILENSSKSNATVADSFPCMNTSSQNVHSWDEHVFIFGTMLFCIGFVGNIITLSVIIRTEKLHTPTYITIACLAFTDVFALTSRYIMVLPNPVSSFFKIPPRQSVFDIFTFLFLHAANFHTVLISYIRYIFIAMPLESLRMSSRKIIKYSQIIWMFSLVMTAIYTVQQILLLEDIFSERMRNWSELAFAIYIAGAPFILIVYFHVKKVCHLHNLSVTERQNRIRIVHSMSVMLLIIIMVYLFTISYPLLYTILDALHLTDTGFLCSVELHELFDLFLLCNNSINPLIYFLFSPPFARIFLRIRNSFRTTQDE